MAVPSTEASVGNRLDPTYQFIRAAEDIQIKNVEKARSANKRMGIGINNKMGEEYYNTYNNAMQEKDNCVNCIFFNKK